MPTLPNLGTLLTPKPLNTGGLFNTKPIIAPAPLNLSPKVPAAQSDPAKVAASTAVKNPAAPISSPVVPPANQSDAIANAAQSQTLVKQLLDKQNMLSQAKASGYGDSDIIQHDNQGNVIPKKETPTPNPTPAPKTMQQEFVERGQGALGEAADIAKKEADVQRKMDVETMGVNGDSNYAGGVRTGLSNIIAQNFGSELKGLSGEEAAANQRGQSFLDAAGKAAPIQVPYSNQVINPLTGEPVGGAASNGTLNDAVSNAVSQIKAGTGYDDALKTLGGYGQAGVNALNQALGPDFNIKDSNAKAAASAGVTESQNITIQGYKSALQQGQNLQSQLSDLITTFGLNPNDVNAANIGVQKIAQNTSDPHYKIISNYVNDVASRYAQILTPPGGSATDTTRAIATGMLDSTASGKSIIDVMKSLDNQAQAVIAGVLTQGSGGTAGANDPLNIR